MSDLRNTYLGQYKLIEPIGHGGMSTVYKAYQESLDRFVAVKVLLPNHDPQFTSRFRREARAIAALQHPNILPIYDYGEQTNITYFVMQYVENGNTLQDRLGTPMPPPQAVALIGQVLAALDYAHARGIVHRDIKPANVLMPTSSWAMLADFGIAKLLNDSQQLTMTGFIIGTAAYMAPEQAAGRPIDARTDLYAVGVMLYELITGQPPFVADTPMALLTQHVYEPPPPPRSVYPATHPAVEEALLQALAKHPDDRYQSAAEMRAEFERVLTLLDKPYVSPKVTELYNSGLLAFQAQRWDEAIDRLNRAMMLAPDHEDAGSLLDMARERRAEARRQYTRPRSQTGPRYVASSGQTTEDLAQPEKTPAPRAAQHIRCPQCGRVVQSDWQVCPYCRAAIAETAAPAVQASPAPLPPASPTVPAAVLLASPLPASVPQPIEAPAVARPRATRRPLGIALLAIVGLLGGGLIWWLLGPPTADGTTRQPSAAPAATSAPALIIATSTPTASPTSTATPSSTPTATPSATPSSTPTATPSATPEPTATAVPPTAKPAPKPTARPRPTNPPPPPPTPEPPTPEPPTPEPPPPPTPEPPTPEPPTEKPRDNPKPRKTPTPEP